jgi:hypothetical protein
LVLDAAIDRQRMLVLGNLISLREIGIEVVLSGEDRVVRGGVSPE